MIDDTKEVMSTVEPIHVAVVGGTGTGTGSGVIETPAGQPNIVWKAVTPIAAILVRFTHLFLVTLTGLLTAAGIGIGTDVVQVAALLSSVDNMFKVSLVVAGVGALKDIATIFGKLEGKFPLWSGAIAVMLALMSGACAGSKPVELPQIPAAVEGADQNLKAATAKGYDVLIKLTDLVNEGSLIEDQAAREGVLPASADQVIDAAILEYVRVARAAQDRLRAGVASWEELKRHLDPVLFQVTQIQGHFERIQALKAKATSWLSRFKDAVLELVAAFIAGSSPNFGGAR